MKGRWRQIVLYHIGVNVGVTSSIGVSLADPGETLPGVSAVFSAASIIKNCVFGRIWEDLEGGKLCRCIAG